MKNIIKLESSAIHILNHQKPSYVRVNRRTYVQCTEPGHIDKALQLRKEDLKKRRDTLTARLRRSSNA